MLINAYAFIHVFTHPTQHELLKIIQGEASLNDRFEQVGVVRVYQIVKQMGDVLVKYDTLQRVQGSTSTHYKRYKRGRFVCIRSMASLYPSSPTPSISNAHA